MPADTVLFASPFFFPEEISSGKYNTELVKALVDRGEEVTVVASHPLYPLWRPLAAEGEFPGAVVLRGGLRVRYPRSPYGRRAMLEAWFAWHAAWQGMRQRRTDRAIAVVPPSLFALLLPLVHRARQRVLVVHDLQARFAAGRGRAGRLAAVLVAFIEKRAFRRYDRIVFLSHSMRAAAIEAYGLRPEKCVVQYPFCTLPQTREKNAEMRDIMREGRKHVVYAGALGEKQKPGQLAELFTAAAERMPDADFHIFSAGRAFEDLRARYAARNVRFHDLVPAGQVAELYRRADVQVIPQAEGSGEAALPSKLPNVIASGAAVLGICDAEAELAEIIRRAGGETIGWDAGQFVEALEELLRGTGAEDRRRRRDRGQSIIAGEFSAGATVAAILDS